MSIKLRLFLMTLLLQTLTVMAALDTIVLQQGLNEYSGTSDTYIGEGLPSSTSNQGHQTYTHAGRC